MFGCYNLFCGLLSIQSHLPPIHVSSIVSHNHGSIIQLPYVSTIFKFTSFFLDDLTQPKNNPPRKVIFCRVIIKQFDTVFQDDLRGRLFKLGTNNPPDLRLKQCNFSLIKSSCRSVHVARFFRHNSRN